MLTKKKIAKITSDALAEVNAIRKLVGLKPLKKMPKATNDGDGLERCFPAQGRDVGCLFIEFGSKEDETYVRLPTPSAIKAYDDYLYAAVA
jgi:hypothetical protein